MSARVDCTTGRMLSLATCMLWLRLVCRLCCTDCASSVTVITRPGGQALHVVPGLLQTGELPAYAIGGVHRGPSTDGGGEINVPISCAGMLVMPGDLMIGDGDGVVAASRSELPELLIRCHDLLAREQATLKAIEEGTLDPDRFDAILRAKGCPV